MRIRTNGVRGIFRVMCWIASALFCAVASASPELDIVSADVPPLSFSVDGKPTGFCVEVVEEIQRRIADQARIHEMPWARAYGMAQGTTPLVLICPKRTPEREALFKWVGPLRLSSFNLYALSKSRLRIDSLQAAGRVDGIVVVRESFMDRKLKEEGLFNLETVNNSMMALRMLLAGRCSLMAIDHEQLQTLLEQAHVGADEIEQVFSAAPTRSYLLFSKVTADPVIANWQAALDAMKSDGSFAKLHRKWFPQEAVSPLLLKRAADPAPSIRKRN